MPSYQEICTAIHDAMETALVPGTLNVVYDYDELPEGMNDTPAMEIYVQGSETSVGSDTDRITFCQPGTGPRRWTNVLVRMDLYARQRSQLDEDWEQALVLMNSVQDTLENQCVCPAFGLAGIGHIKWEVIRGPFERGAGPRGPLRYSGYRFELTIGVY